MSRPGRWAGAALAALFVMPLPTSAQERSAEELRRELERLRPLREAAVIERDAHRVRVEAAKLDRAIELAHQDTLQVELVTIVTPTDQVDTARRLFGEVWEEHYSNIRRSPGLERSTFVFQWADSYAPIHVVGYPQRVQLRSYIPEERVKEAIAAAIGTSIAFDLSAFDTNVGGWMSAVAFNQFHAAGVYRELATARSISTRACVDDDIEACILSLGLDVQDHGGAIFDWYTAEERRALVGANQHFWAGRANGPDWDACIRQSDLDACDGLLLESRRRFPPLTGRVRASLLDRALERGGSGAWGRLLDDPGMSPSAALEAASGLEIETLVAEWRQWAIDGRPETYDDLAPEGGVILMWTLLLAAVAMRSTRWRLG